MARQTIEVVVKDKTAAALGNIDKRLKTIERNTGTVSKGFGGAASAAKAFVAVLGAREVIQFAARIKDTTAEFQNYRNQLRLITDGQEDLNRVFNLLTQTAKENRTSFGETVDLFTKLRITTEALGIAEERVISVTSKLSQALQVAGADGNTAASVIRQFGQAMASGEVRGDEFRSLVEGLGPALAIMARESGITVGELRKMSQAGELTAQTMFELLENSNSLTNAFQSMDPTISQLETGLSDAFDRALVKLGEVTGFTKAYEKSIMDLTRTFDNFAGTNKLASMSAEELFKAVKDGSVPAKAATEELISRYRDLDNTIRVLGINLDLDFGLQDALGINDQGKQAVADMVNQITKLEKELAKVREETEAATKAEQERIDNINQLLKPYQQYINLGDKFIKQDFGTPLEKANAKLERAKIVLEKLTEAQKKLDESGFNADGYKDLSEQIAGAEKAVAGFAAEVEKLSEKQQEAGTTYADFLANLKKTTKETVTESEFQKKAITDISALYRDGAVSLEYYEAAMKSLNMEEHLGINAKNELIQHIDKLNEKYSAFFNNAEGLARKQALRDIESYKEALDMKLISEEEFASKKLSIEKSLREEILNIEKENQKKLDDLAMASLMRRLRTEQNFVYSSEDQKLIARQEADKKEDALAQEKLKTLQEYEKDRVGFVISSLKDSMQALGQHNKKAFEAAKALAIAEAVMNTYTMAVNSYKSLSVIPVIGPVLGAAAAAAAIATGMAQVSAIRSQQYTGPREKGGPVGMGQSYLVGERGPEIFTPNAGGQITPNNAMGGEVNVNFNITTVDAASFDQLLVERRGTIVGLINQAVERRGRQGVV